MMRFARVGPFGQERLAACDANGDLRDLSSFFSADDPSWIVAIMKGEFREVDLGELPVVDSTERIGACVPTPTKFVGVGLNYVDHVQEVGMAVPVEPTVFLKAPSCLCGPYDDVIIPRGGTMLDWEVELGVVLGQRVQHAELEEARASIAGYCVVIDFSERRFQLEQGGQWTKGKSADTFGPIGPWLVTASEIEADCPLRLELSVSGVQKQRGSTANMIWSSPELISYVSQFMSLEVGDIIATGTPAGVGHARRPPEYLAEGEFVEAVIERLGRQAHRVRAG